VKARIVRPIGGAMRKNKESTPCVLCGDFNRGNKGRFEVALACGYGAEIWVCKNCSGEEHTTRTGMIELPYSKPVHYHVRGRTDFTFWDFMNALSWVKEFWQAPDPKEIRPGVHVISIPSKDVELFRCEGKSTVSGETMTT
jgi:hypothetical protein